MAKRYTDTTIWKKQRWFKKLSPTYKLAWKYITDTCDHAGILKVDFSEFVDDLGLEEFNIMDFIKHCNTDFDKSNGKKIERERVKLMKNNIVWLTGFIKFQYENKDLLINPAVPAVYSALTILNGYGMLEEGLNKGYFTLSQEYKKDMLRTKDKDKDKEVNKKKEDTEFIFGLQEIYDKSWEDYSKILNGQAKLLNENKFLLWKEFVDYVNKNGFNNLFDARFVTPIEFDKLVSDGFTKPKWDKTLKSILATGVKPEHNLFFRIPQFMGYGIKDSVSSGELVQPKINLS